MENILLNQKGYGTKIIKQSFNVFKQNWSMLVIAIFIYFTAGTLQGLFQEVGILYLILGAISVFITLGVIKLVLSIITNKTPSLSTIFTSISSSQFIHGVLFSVALTLISGIISIPILLIIFPFTVGFGGYFPFLLISIASLFLIMLMIWISIIFSAGLYLIVDKQVNFFQALKYSVKITKGYRWKLFIIAIRSFIILLGGLLLLVIGLLVATPIVSIIYAKTYKDLVSIYEEKNGLIGETNSDSEGEKKSEEIIEVEEVLEGDQTEESAK